jgi:hypothetical protein
MSTTTTIITNATNGAITRITTIQHAQVNYGMIMAALLAIAFITLGLRAMFKSGKTNRINAEK